MLHIITYETGNTIVISTFLAAYFFQTAIFVF
jgi:hypothetical protein